MHILFVLTVIPGVFAAAVPENTSQVIFPYVEQAIEAAQAAQASQHVEFYPPLDYFPHPTGIPFATIDDNKQTSEYMANFADIGTSEHNRSSSTHTSCPALTPDNPSTYWLGSIMHNGLSSFLNPTLGTYKVFRNVVNDFGADNTGKNDASGAINNAIRAGVSNYQNRAANAYGTTGQPAVVYLPGGTYLLKSPLQLYVGTVVIGDPINPPVLKASSSFTNSYIIYGKDPNHGGTINFYIALKNVVIDSTNLSPATKITLLDWTVSQATQLANVRFQMPNYSTGHVGLKTGEWAGGDGYNSNLIINDISFHGGAVGMSVFGQQWVFKSITFSGCTVGAQINGTDVVVTNSYFEYCDTAIDASQTSGSLVIIDTSTSNIGTFLTSTNYYQPNGVVLENIVHSGKTVVMAGQTLLTGNVPDTWYRGNAYKSGSSTHHWIPDGTTVNTPRTEALLRDGKYVAIPPPTYQQYSASKFINMKSVSDLPVKGDGFTDDTANINAILSRYAGCAIIYWPAGTYIVRNTIFIPAGSRIFGDAYGTVISAIGSNFYNPKDPTPMVKVGNSGDVGVAQISDMLLTVADVLQGCKLLEINIAGPTPGAVGLWNTHFRIGGAVGSSVRTNCGSTPSACKAAWGLLHLTSTSSAYIENMWGWTADHDLDGAVPQTISVGRGALIEATRGTWLVGTGICNDPPTKSYRPPHPHFYY